MCTRDGQGMSLATPEGPENLWVFHFSYRGGDHITHGEEMFGGARIKSDCTLCCVVLVDYHDRWELPKVSRTRGIKGLSEIQNAR